MKTGILLATFFVVGLLSSCTKVNNVTETKQENKTTLSQEESRALLHSLGHTKISHDDVMSYANAAIYSLDGSNTRTITRKIGEVKPCVEARTVITRSGEKMITDTTMYIVNFADDMGYTVISTDGLTQNILAIVEQGSLESIEDVANGNHPLLSCAIVSHHNKRDEMLAKQDE